jgi:hypothetical protein
VLDQARDRALEWGTATTPHPAQHVSGDVALVIPVPDGALVALIDGLGHGHMAARAAQIARETVCNAAGVDIIALAHRCQPAIGTVTLDIRRGDILMLATDGIAPGFGEALDVSGSPQQIAVRILAEHWTGADDGLVLVLRYLGTGT